MSKQEEEVLCRLDVHWRTLIFAALAIALIVFVLSG